MSARTFQPSPTRRDVLAAGLGAAAIAATGIRPGRTEEAKPALRELARAKGIDLGSAFSGHGDAKYLALVARHCEVLTPEWQLKPRFLKSSKDAAYRFAESDRIAAFCNENRQKLHGHTLFWHQEPIRWAESDDFEAVKQHYGGFIRDVIAHYPQAVSWDVFNEIVEEKTRFRNEFLIRKFGFQFIDFCFRTAHEAAPGARLVINDYNLECPGALCGGKQDHMLAVVRKLQAMGTPIHAVGVQGHLSSKYPPSPKTALAFIRRVADLGCDVYLSEMDVNDSQLPADIGKRDAAVAGYYEQFLSTVLGHKAVKRVMFWGISDSNNWIARGEAGERRKKGAARPALFDADNEPKPAFDAVVRVLKAAPSRA